MFENTTEQKRRPVALNPSPIDVTDLRPPKLRKAHLVFCPDESSRRHSNIPYVMGLT